MNPETLDHTQTTLSEMCIKGRRTLPCTPWLLWVGHVQREGEGKNEEFCPSRVSCEETSGTLLKIDLEIK